MIGRKIYPTDIWDYLGDMPHMPSRQDRDQLLQAGEKERVSIWDYFFRIDPDDVGEPQKNEIVEIDKKLAEKISEHNQKQDNISSQITALRGALFLKRLRSFLYGFGGFLIAGISYKVSTNYTYTIPQIDYICIYIPIISGFLMWLSVAIVGRGEISEIRGLEKRSDKLRENHNQYVKEEVERKNFLRDEIRTLKRKIPSYLPDDLVRELLQDDFKNLWERSKDVTALSNRLIDIDSNKVDKHGNPLRFPNPIPVVGPAELQRPDRIPLIFLRNTDLSKHLSARRSFYMSKEEKFEVLYGMYYLEHILIADNMLATYGLFYDFITGKCYAEEITEQYYKDVVAIATTHEFREISLSVNDKATKFIEDAPTFTLSLASGEHRTVTFVSEKYFLEIKEKINVSEEDVSRIYWIVWAEENADMAVSALRARLRLHKETPDELNRE